MERPFDPLHPRGFVTTRIPFCFPSPHRTRKLVFRSRNGNDEVSTTRVSSFEFRISSTRFFHFSIFLSLSIINFSPQLLHLSFLFPSVTDPLLLSSIHSFLSLRATLHLFFLLLSWVHLDAFPLSLSVDPRSLPRWTRATQCLSAGRRGVATSRERVCVGHRGAWWGLWENSHAGDCVPAASGAHHHRRYGESCSTSCFHAPRAFHRARKKRGEEQGEGEKGISLGASRENSIR